LVFSRLSSQWKILKLPTFEALYSQCCQCKVTFLSIGGSVFETGGLIKWQNVLKLPLPHVADGQQLCFSSASVHILIHNASAKLSPFGSVASFPNYSNKFECVGSIQH
jgi:hypothetical protein